MNIIKSLGRNWIISLILTIPILFIVPYPTKYRAKIILTNQVGGERYVYSDIDSDGNSEKIRFPVYTKLKNVPGIIIEKDGIFYYQWIISGKPIPGRSFHIGDYDLNQMKEVYLFTYENDSVFINGVEPNNEKVIFKRKFLTEFDKYKNNVETIIYKSLMTDINGDGFQELVLFCYSGFSYTNRKIIACDIKNDSLIFSPKTGSVIISNISMFDWDNDGLPEFTGWVPSWGNCTINNYPYTDSLAWLMVVDNDLSFLFEPVPVGEFSSEVDVVPFICGEKSFLAVLYHYRGLNDTSFIALYTPQGKLVRKKNITHLNCSGQPRLFLDPENKHDKLYLINYQVEQWDSSLNIINKYDNGSIGYTRGNFDLDGDGSKEYLFLDENKCQIIIFRKGFKHPVRINVPNKEGTPTFSIIKKISTHTRLSIFQPPYEYIVSYGTNPLFYFMWLIYAGIYSGMYLIVALIGKIQESRIQQRYNNEKRIAELQLKAIKSQIDPHFTMNMVNTIGSLFARKQNEKAYEMFTKYSRLLHITITSSENISITLSEELDYVKNYLSIQQFRMENKFKFTFRIENKIDPQKVKIPKMMIHTFAENSVKHGISHLKRKGILDIDVSMKDEDLMISITDNGVGRKKSKEYSTFGTGRGLKILDEIIELFYKIEGVKIRYELNDKTDNSGKICGTIATIYIPQVH